MKYSIEINESLQKELNKSLKRNCKLAMIIGIIGLAFYIAITMFVEHFILEVLSWVFIALAGGGIGLLIVIKTTNKKASERKLIGHYELFEDHMFVVTEKEGIQISSIKLFYKDVVKIKETENFIFLYADKQTAFPIQKNKLSPEDLSTAKLWINSHKTKK